MKNNMRGGGGICFPLNAGSSLSWQIGTAAPKAEVNDEKG